MRLPDRFADQAASEREAQGKEEARPDDVEQHGPRADAAVTRDARDDRDQDLTEG